MPIGRRVLYGFLAREGLRLSEALGLTWRDIDLDTGAITLDRNKTNRPRAWALDPGVVRALRHFRGGPSQTGAAREFREHLLTAGVARHELHHGTGERMPIRVHDLRATFVTCAMAAGRSEAWITDRTGHTSSQMLRRYQRTARMAAELDLGGLAPLDVALGLAPVVAQGGGQQGNEETEQVTETAQENGVGRLGLEPRTNGLKRRNSEDLGDPTDAYTALSQALVIAAGQYRWSVVERLLEELRRIDPHNPSGGS